jgi:hypothetical protein
MPPTGDRRDDEQGGGGQGGRRTGRPAGRRSARALLDGEATRDSRRARWRPCWPRPGRATLRDAIGAAAMWTSCPTTSPGGCRTSSPRTGACCPPSTPSGAATGTRSAPLGGGVPGGRGRARQPGARNVGAGGAGVRVRGVRLVQLRGGVRRQRVGARERGGGPGRVRALADRVSPAVSGHGQVQGLVVRPGVSAVEI